MVEVALWPFSRPMSTGVSSERSSPRGAFFGAVVTLARLVAIVAEAQSVWTGTSRGKDIFGGDGHIGDSPNPVAFGRTLRTQNAGTSAITGDLAAGDLAAGDLAAGDLAVFPQ